MHGRVTPLAGGLAIIAALLLAACGILTVAMILGEDVLGPVQSWLGILAGVLLVAGFGVADDCGLIRVRHKLLGQVLAVGCVLAGGLVIRRLNAFGLEFELGFLSYPFTAFWLLGAVNALNLLDGMDGLLATIAITICGAVAVIAGFAGDATTALVAVLLAGAVLGFLRYNLPPASIFLGDAGSMALGLLLGALTLRCLTAPTASLAFLPALTVFTLPVLDTGAAIIRRKFTGRSLYTTDRGHLHHVLLRHGYSVSTVLLIVLGLGFLCATGACASALTGLDYFAALSLLAVMSILVGGRLFGHAEFKLLLNRCLSVGASFFQGRQRPQQIEVHLQGSADWQQLWQGLTREALKLNLQSIRLDVNAPALHEGYHARWDRPHQQQEYQDQWYTVVPLTADGQPVGRLEIRGLRDDVPVCDKILAVARLVEDFEEAATRMTVARRESETALSDSSLIVPAHIQPAEEPELRSV